MNTTFQKFTLLLAVWPLFTAPLTRAQATRQTTTYRELKTYLDSISAIDTHDHLAPFDSLPIYVQTDHGFGMTLWGLLVAHYGWINPLPRWNPGESFDQWWTQVKPGFDNARATSFYPGNASRVPRLIWC